MYFKDAKVGDRVWDYLYGEGEIVAKRGVYLYSKFKIGLVEKEATYYTKNGKMTGDSCASQRLFYYDSRPIVITQDDVDGLPEDATGYMLEPNFYHMTGDDVVEAKYCYTRKVRREKINPDTFIGHEDFIPSDQPEFIKDMIEEEKKPMSSCQDLKWFQNVNPDGEITGVTAKWKIPVVHINESHGINRTRQHTQFECPNCSGIVNKIERYCKHCGVKFEWEDMHSGYDYE